LRPARRGVLSVKIAHVSTYDIAGGAARAAYRLHRGLLSLGHESRVLALYKTSSDPTVLQFVPPMDLPTRLRRRVKRRLLQRSEREIAARPGNSTFFSDDRSQHGADALRRSPASDILNLHWVANFVDYRALFEELPRGLPMVWTFHDMNSFTGGCHYDEGCGKFRERCGACPQLGSFVPGDLSSQVWSRKREAFSSNGAQQLHIVTPSRWLADEVAKSSLLSGRAATVIPYGVDTATFQPRDRRLAREKYGLPLGAKTVLFVADSAVEKRKGLSLLSETLQTLKEAPDLWLLAVGRGASSFHLGPRMVTVDYVGDEMALSFVYSAADIFVLPSLQDNLPNTALEALACGVPTVAFDVGGLRDIIQDGHTGYLVGRADIQALGAAINAVLQGADQRARMAGECRSKALAEYTLELQARRYVALYRNLLESEMPPQASLG
jgi:glycosyltransferase involved in cell wall biosynthesis